jgi:hypothetical protein
MCGNGSVDEHYIGARTGKLMSDPAVWYPINAKIDGIDAGSPNPIEHLKYMVYQRRMFIEALRTKALLLAILHNEGAADAAKAYIEMSVPFDQEEVKLSELRKEQIVQDIDKMLPIALSSVRVGTPTGSYINVSER